MESPKKEKNVFEMLCWIACLISVPVAGFVIFTGLAASQGAPQEAVVICLGLAIVILPYCFSRAVSELYR